MTERNVRLWDALRRSWRCGNRNFGQSAYGRPGIYFIASGRRRASGTARQFPMKKSRTDGRRFSRAVELAQKDDIVLIAGKGHENYQILKTGTIHFDDKEVAIEAIRRKLNG